MRWCFDSRHATADELCKLARRADRVVLPLLNNRLRNPAAESLLAEIKNDLRQGLGTQAGQQSPGRLAPLGVEPQIQGAFRVETEPALACRPTDRSRDPSRARCPAPMRHAGRVQDLGQFAEIGLGNLNRQPREISFRARNDLGIAIHSHHAARRSHTLGQQPRVSAASQRAVRHARHPAADPTRQALPRRAPERGWKHSRP